MKIYCMRHAEALSQADDTTRPLSPEGEAEAKQVAQFFIDRDIKIDQVLHSEKLRSIQTAGAFLNKLQVPLGSHELPALAQDDAVSNVVDMIQHWQGDTLLVGHLPYIAQLVGELVANQQTSLLVNFLPAAVVCLEKTNASQWVIDWVVSPQLLKYLNI